jgi:ribosomal protein S18 acetylase RimI-like enzyme
MTAQFSGFVAVFILLFFITLSSWSLTHRDLKIKGRKNRWLSLGLSPLSSNHFIEVKLQKSTYPPKIKFDIKVAKWFDLASIVSLRLNVFYPHLCGVEISNESAKQRILEKIRQRRRFGATNLVAYESNSFFSFNLIGAVEMSPADFYGTVLDKIRTQKKLYIADLCIRKDYRRMGIASSILYAIEAYALANNYQEIYLHVEVENSVARKLYIDKGYVDVGHNNWATEFTENKLQKPATEYVLLFKSVLDDTRTVHVHNP